MVKRRTESDSEEEKPSVGLKRARTADSDEGEDDGDFDILSNLQNGKNKGKARSVSFNEEDQYAEEDAEAEEENRFEQEHRESILAGLEEKRKVHGGIADHGIIESIEMHQFMCHKFLTFTFGPQINFIIGHNGSGKSAVLSAITVALGGKATSTGRGSGLKSFIREGQSVAEVTISLKNQGEEAYKPKEYGKSIIITRRFSKEGSSTWKIRSKDGRVISTKKDELSAICDHMNIQVDNPMNVLTQDAARQFLSASHPNDKYKFFLRGTQLSQLSDEYNTCYDNIRMTYQTLAQKREVLPDLRSAFRDATLRFEEAAKAREQKKKADELKKELAWAHVKGKEEEMTAQISEAAKMSRRLPKIQQSLDEAAAKVDEETEKVTQLEAELDALGEINDLMAQKEAFQAESRNNKSRLSDYITDMKRMDTSLKATNAQIEHLDAQIVAENNRAAAHSQAKLEETKRRLEEAREAVRAAESAFETIRTRKNEQHAENEKLKAEGIAMDQEKAQLQNSIQQCEGMIERSKQSEKNSLIPYGKNIKEVLEKISTMKWVGDAPLGPLGVYVKAKDPRTWGDLLRSQLGSFLTAFAVTDARDRDALKSLLQQSGNGRTLIIIYEKDIFDYGSGEPPENMLTVLRALEISDPYVLRILINQARIERQLLAHLRVDGEKNLRGLNGGGSAWTADGFQVRVFPEGGSSSVPLNMRGGNDATSLLLTGRDAPSEIRHYRDEIRKHETAYNALLEKSQTTKGRYIDGRRALESLTAQENRAKDTFGRAKQSLSTLQQEANEDLPIGVAGFQAAKEEAEAEKASILEQFEDAANQKAEIDAQQKILLTKMNAIKKQLDEYEDRRRAIGAKVEDAAENRLKAQTKKKHFESKLFEEKDRVKKAEDAAKVLQEEFTNWTQKAEEYCTRVESPRKAETVERLLRSVQQVLQERERSHGATVEEMTIEVNKAKTKLETAERDLKQMSTLNKVLKKSLIVRLQRWQEFRRHIALRCKLVFGFHLSHRGYYGKVLFNHEAGTLTLKVQTDDQVATQGSRDKDPRSLSGGEKSFSTICLLLSLWESIGCPLRCLDEFDVFMDAVNRRISMKMMIDTANSSDKKQYILITPQDMNNVHIGTTVRVHRMTDPERGQAVLNF